MEKFQHHATGIRQDTEIIQETTSDVYGEIGRENCDGKGEFGERRTNAQLVLGDELELDSLRNVSLKKIRIGSEIYEYPEDLLGRNLNEVIAE
ncbi:MAG: phosphoribosylaminoimidazolesuccinocarboxamide synthase [bacterium]